MVDTFKLSPLGSRACPNAEPPSGSFCRARTLKSHQLLCERGTGIFGMKYVFVFQIVYLEKLFLSTRAHFFGKQAKIVVYSKRIERL